MYSVSADFLTAIKKDVLKFHWSGSINTTTPIALDDDNFLSGQIQKRISGKKLEIGTVYTSQLTAELYLPTVSRYELYGKEITVSVSVAGALDVIPMGTYIITEATQTMDHIQIKANDDMIKFSNIAFAPINHTSMQLPYTWLAEMCLACGITLGNTQAQIKDLPNGKRYIAYADIVADVKTWRDLLSYLSATLCTYTYIGRDRKLYLGSYDDDYVDEIPANQRYSSGLSDFRTTYNGIYHICKAEGVREYVENENEDGLILDLGTNPFLQFTKPSTRIKALREIIDVWNDIYYVPFKSDVPLRPHYDAGDVLKFTGNQAGEYDYGIITEIVYKFDGSMKVICSGENPKLAGAQDRFAKTVEGLSGGYSNAKETGGKDFWIISTTNTEAITVSDTEIQVTEIEWTQSTYFQDIEMLLTIDASLSATARVRLRLNVDDNQDFEMIVTEDKSLKGERVFHCTNPQKIGGKGSHVAKVFMTVTDSALTVGDLR